MSELDLFSYFSAATYLILSFLVLIFIFHTYYLPKIATGFWLFVALGLMLLIATQSMLWWNLFPWLNFTEFNVPVLSQESIWDNISNMVSSGSGNNAPFNEDQITYQIHVLSNEISDIMEKGIDSPLTLEEIRDVRQKSEELEDLMEMLEDLVNR